MIRFLLAAAMLTALFPFAPAAATPDCIDYRDLPGLIGRDPSVTSQGPVALAGDRALVAGGGTPRLWVNDVSDPTRPVNLGSALLPDDPLALVLRGDVAYVACQEAGVAIYLVQEDGDPVAIGSIPTLDRAQDVAVAGDVLYVADRGAGWAAFDLAVPGAPVEIARESGTWTDRVAVDGDLLLTVWNAEAYVELYTWDVSDPSAAVPLGVDDNSLAGCPGYPWCSWIADVELRTNRAYALVNSRDCIDENCWEYAYSYDLIEWDLSDPTNPDRVAFLGLASTRNTPWSGTGLALAGDRGYVSGTSGRLFVLDLSDPAAPARMFGVLTGVAGRGIAVRSDAGGDLAFVADAGLSVYDVTHAELPDRLGGSRVDDPMQDVAFVGGVAYTVGSTMSQWPGTTRVRGWDTADPAHPEQLFSSAGSGYGFFGDLEAASGDLWISGPANYGKPLQRSDLQPGGEPGPPETVGGPALDIEPVGSHLLVAEGLSGLTVYETFPDALPAVVGHEGTKSARVAADDDLAVVLQGSYFPGGTVHTLDISDPAAPTFLGEVGLSPAFRWIDLRGSLAAVGGGQGVASDDLRLVDVSDPYAPAEIGSLGLPGPSEDGELVGSLLYVGLGGGGVAAIDVGDPALPELLGVIPSDRVSALRVAGGMVLACEGDRLTGFPLHCSPALGATPLAAAPAGLRVAPNPFRDAVTIRLDLPRTAAARVDLYDAAGRHVRRLLTGAAVAELVWDGRDGAGRRVAPGVYFLRAEAAGRTTTTKITRLR